MYSSSSSSYNSIPSRDASFYEQPVRRASLLHPVGLEMLKHYKELKAKGTNGVDKKLVSHLVDAIRPVMKEEAAKISSSLLDCLQTHWLGQNKSSSSSVRGKLEQAKRFPDGVIWSTGLVQKEGKEVQLIIQVSVDKNGLFPFDYANLIQDPSKMVLLFVLHIDRIDLLDMSQEVFLYSHSEKEKKRKMGFLWREYYKQGADKENFEFLEKTCEGMVRSLDCAFHKAQAPTMWTRVSDEVAIVQENGKKKVLKLFDNRHRPTFRRPDVWLKEEPSWIQSRLKPSIRFDFRESKDLATLGKPGPCSPNKRKYSGNHIEYERRTPYPKGSVLVLEYEYQNGTHYASRVSHFLDIAIAISELHKCNIVHGDIRGFNMLHPHPKAKGITNLTKSILIDFDLSGKVNQDVYPPGYSTTVTEIHHRSGAAGEKLEFKHDWKDLGSVMRTYRAVRDPEGWKHSWNNLEAWEDLGLDIAKDAKPVKLIEDFIKKHGDIAIVMNKTIREKMENVNLPGTTSRSPCEYQNGTHYASRVSHFLDIAVAISEMHKCNIVHGDICGSNMLHPHPEAEGSLTKSILIDFDLSGKVNQDVYPPGYSTTVTEIHHRSGAAGEKLEFKHDWKDLAAVMRFYDPAELSDPKLWPVWHKLRLDIKNCLDIAEDERPVILIKNFIESHGDFAIVLDGEIREEMENVNKPGTGSPNKRLQKPRGTISVEKKKASP